MNNRWAVIGALFVGALGAGSLQAGSDEGTALPPDLTWLALGDSYSSGEGLPYPDVPANPPGRTCERATGRSTVGVPSRAYAVVARDDLDLDASDVDFVFVACTGDISDQWAARWNEGLGSARADLVTMSYGGNNIGFADVVLDCVGISAEGGFNAMLGGSVAWALNPALGCNTSEDELRRRIDVLTGNADGALAKGDLDLPRLYEQIATQAVHPGGHVVVTGYPNIVEESGRWTWRLLSGNRCHRIRRADTSMFRSVAGYLNRQIALAVADADGRYNDVRFHWVDTSQVYENDATGRHGLCTGSPWLNGLTAGTEGAHSGAVWGRIFRSFHPKQEGHDALGHAVADVVRNLDWSDLERLPQGVAVPQGLHGDWSGTITSSNTDIAPFTVSLAVDGSGATFRSPAGGCDARLVPYAADGDAVSLRAGASSGDCQPQGSWRLEPSGPDRIRYTWSGPSSVRVDTGELIRTDLEANIGWPTTAGIVQGPPVFYTYLGAEFIFPSWVSCTDDETVCIVGAGDEVRVYVLQKIRYVTSVPLDAADPALELAALGATEEQIDELLSP